VQTDLSRSRDPIGACACWPEFFARYPDIRVDVGVSDRHVDLIGDNVDCVIRGGVLTDLEMLGRQIGNASWITCATPGYLNFYVFGEDVDLLKTGPDCLGTQPHEDGSTTPIA